MVNGHGHGKWLGAYRVSIYHPRLFLKYWVFLQKKTRVIGKIMIDMIDAVKIIIILFSIKISW